MLLLAPALLSALALLPACRSDCLGDDCDVVPDEPWDPGSGGDSGSGDAGAYGDAGSDGGGGDGGGGDGGGDGGSPAVILTVRDCDVVASIVPDAGVSSVSIAGEFNDWTPEALSGPDTDGAWSIDLGELAPGEYAFKYLFDGEWEDTPPADVYTKWSGGVENRDLRVGDCMLPLLQTVDAAASPDGHLTATVQIASAADEVPIDPDAITVTLGGEEVTPSVDVEDGTITVDVTGLAPGKHSLRVWASDDAGRAAENEPLFVPLWVEDTPFSWTDGILYFAFTDRFRNGDGEADPVGGLAQCADYQGGDYLGILHALQEGYFQELGVRTIWLSPVYDNPDGGYLGASDGHTYSGYHGYWPIDPLQVEERFGDTEEAADERLQEVIAEAHRQGIRVLFDLVLNHVHEDHVYVEEHPEWFGDGCVCGTEGCGWEEKPIECWFTDYLPDLNYKNHDIVERVLADTLRLVETYDVDALRIDAAKHMDHVIMRSLSMRLRDDYEAGGGAPFYLVGETFTSDPGLIMDYVGATELDAQFDFPLYYAIRNAFAYDGSFYDLEATVDSDAAWYGDAPMSPFIGNHDVDRFATAVSGQAGDCWSDSTVDPMKEGGGDVTEWDIINKQSMALAFDLTQPGVPLLYYGDEVGLAGGGDPDNRRTMDFDPYLSANQATLLDRVRAIGQARAGSTALQRGDRVQLWVDDSLLVYARDNGGGDVAVVAMNKGGGSRSESIDVSSLSIEGATLTDAIGGGSVTVSGGHLSLSLASWQYAIWVK